MARHWIAAAALVVTLVLVATLNGGGYQYGAADQAFYIPAIHRHLDPALFPRDRLLIDSQDKLNVFTAILASVSRGTGLSLQSMFLAGYLAAMVALFGAVVTLGRALCTTPWAVVALGAAVTLRHRIARTGANTFESYFHPRVLAFAVGAWAIVALLRGRRLLAIVLVAAAAVVHPTTALWFIVWVGAALLVEAPPRARRWLVAAGALAALVGAWMVSAGPLAGRLVRMDAEWVALLGAKDYVFPHQWPWWSWPLTFSYPVVILAAHRWRRKSGLAVAGERGVVAGALALFAALLAAIPLAEARVAIVVQFQVPRVLWMLDLLATSYAVWWLAEGWLARRRPTPPPSGAVPMLGAAAERARSVEWEVADRRDTAGRRWHAPAVVVCGVMVLAAAARGVYVKWVEHPERPLVRYDLADDDWRDAMRWLARQPVSAHVLADPGHAWRHGSTVRVAAARDVLLEEVKDLSMAMYTREIAARVIERRDAVGDFATLTSERALSLARRYGLDYLVIDRPLDLPPAYRNARFWIYALVPPSGG